MEDVLPFPTLLPAMAPASAGNHPGELPGSAVISTMDRSETLPVAETAIRQLTQWQMRLKRVEDVVLALLATSFVFPVLAMIALAIKLESRGPVLSRERRAGGNDRSIHVWSFRTLRTHARHARELCQTACGDPRETRIGRILRRTGLDALPQLFNVLDGSMSIVGLPPHALAEEYSTPHCLKPGITGWAQLNSGRGGVGTPRKLQTHSIRDRDYIENWSLWLDLRIMVRTASILLSDNNAY